MANEKVDVEQPTGPPAEPPIMVELRTLVKQAEADDETALPRLRQLLDNHPEIWHHVGDVAGIVERGWIGHLAGGDPLAVESMKRTITEMRADLAGDHPTRVERMLVDQVIVCWLESKYMESASALGKQGSVENANYRLKRLESAQRRYEGAIKSLTSMRALLPTGLAPAGAIKLHEEKERKRA